MISIDLQSLILPVIINTQQKQANISNKHNYYNV